MIYKRIYKKLEQLGIIGLIEVKTEFSKSEVLPFPTLHFDRLQEKDDAVVIALAYYYIEKDGTLRADPDMKIRVNPAQRTAEALTYKRSMPAVYNEVYPEPSKVDLRIKKELNSYLDRWLRNTLDQGHRF
jgi:hypothetical protein